MRPQTSRQRGAGDWKHFLGGLLSSVLLPVPALATIANFNWGTPSYSFPNGNPNPFASYSTSPAGSSIGVLYLTPGNNTWTMYQGDTWSITATFDVVNTPSYLGGNWANLNMINSYTRRIGDVNIAVLQSGNNTSNNMFGSSGTDFTSAPLSASPVALTITDTGAGGQSPAPLPVGTGYSVQVTISFQQHMQFSTLDSTPITLTLQEVSSP